MRKLGRLAPVTYGNPAGLTWHGQPAGQWFRLSSMAVGAPGVAGLGSVPPEAVQLELKRILACDSFAGSKRLSAFLRFVVESTLSGDAAAIKEYRIGVEVYGRGPGFDSRIDNIVRVEANRLRTKLRDYYEGIGSDDPIRIEIPKGTYTPLFYPFAGVIPAAPDPQPPAAARRFPLALRAAIWASAMALLATVSYAYWYAHSHFAATKLRRSVAVLGFKNITGHTADTAWLSTAFSEMLTMDLAEADRLRTIPVDSVSQMKRDLGMTDSDGLMPANLQRVRQSVGADLAIGGAYTVLTGQDNDQIRLDLRVQDTHSGETVATVSETGTARALFSLVDRTASELRRKLRLQTRSGETSLAALPAAPGAMRLYAEGLEQLRRSNAVSARESLERAVEADPSNALAYSALANAWHALGYEGKAQESAQKAYQLAGRLNRVEQLEIEGRYRSYSHQWDAAIRIYDTLCRMLPDSIDDGLTLVDAQFWAGRPRDALAGAVKLRKLPPPLRDDPRIDLAQARALGGLADFRGTRDYAGFAAGKAQAQGARLLYAKARLLESGAMSMLAIPGDDALRDEARRICMELGDQACVLQALRQQANKIVFNDPARAKPLYEQGLQISRRMGSLETANLLAGLSVAYCYLDDFPEAEKALKEGIAVWRDAGIEDLAEEMNLAGVYQAEGRLADALKMYGDVVQVARANGGRETLGNALAGLADVERLQGNPAGARQHSEEALAVLRGLGVALDTAGALNAVGDVLADAGDVASAQKNYEEAVKIEERVSKTGQQPYGGSLELGRAELGLANVALAAKQPAVAQSRAAAAIRDSTNAKDTDTAVLARAVLIRALLAQHQTAQAESEAKDAAAAAAGRRNPYPRLNLALAADLLKAASGQRAEALQDLSSVISNASRLGYVSVALAARQQAREAR